MGIVFDHVDGVVQRQPEDGGGEPAAAEGAGADDPQKLTAELEHQERRKQRLMAD